jgi:FixJ family two-component response regulator
MRPSAWAVQSSMSASAAPLILIVDDDAAVLNSLGFLLEAEGFKVRTLSDVGMLLGKPMPDPDCLVLDYSMPVMNGLDVLRWLREKKVKAPAILITDHPASKLSRRALAAGFSKVVEKPLLGTRLADDIREVLLAGRDRLLQSPR